MDFKTNPVFSLFSSCFLLEFNASRPLGDQSTTKSKPCSCTEIGFENAVPSLLSKLLHRLLLCLCSWLCFVSIRYLPRQVLLFPCLLSGSPLGSRTCSLTSYTRWSILTIPFHWISHFSYTFGAFASELLKLGFNEGCLEKPVFCW